MAMSKKISPVVLLFILCTIVAARKLATDEDGIANFVSPIAPDPKYINGPNLQGRPLGGVVAVVSNAGADAVAFDRGNNNCAARSKSGAGSTAIGGGRDNILVRAASKAISFASCSNGSKGGGTVASVVTPSPVSTQMP